MSPVEAYKDAAKAYTENFEAEESGIFWEYDTQDRWEQQAFDLLTAYEKALIEEAVVTA